MATTLYSPHGLYDIKILPQAELFILIPQGEIVLCLSAPAWSLLELSLQRSFIFETLSSFIFKLKEFIEVSLCCCKGLGLSTAQWTKMTHLISKFLNIVIASCSTQANDPKVSHC